MTKNPDGKFKRSYRKWSSMCRRCYDPSHPAFHWYGERGIAVCPEWLGKNGYANFVAFMGEPPEGLTLERKENDKGYSPDNCRWATWKEQAANRRRTGPRINPNSLRQKAKAAGISYHVAYLRIKRMMWSEEKAFSTPVNPRGRLVGWRKHPSV